MVQGKGSGSKERIRSIIYIPGGTTLLLESGQHEGSSVSQQTLSMQNQGTSRRPSVPLIDVISRTPLHSLPANSDLRFPWSGQPSSRCPPSRRTINLYKQFSLHCPAFLTCEVHRLSQTFTCFSSNRALVPALPVS